MTAYFVQRLLLLIPTFLGITLIVFLIVRLAPGDPAELRAAGGLGAAAGAGISVEKKGAVDEAMSQWRAQYGLDKPLYVQYGIWIKNIFTLSFGDSFKDSQPVWGKIAERLPVTLTLNFWSLLVVYLVAIPLGIYSATHPNSFADQATTLVAFILFAVPLVWAATMSLVFLLRRRLFIICFRPVAWSRSDAMEELVAGGASLPITAWHLFLPVVLLSYDGFAGLSRYMRSSMLRGLAPGLCSGGARQRARRRLSSSSSMFCAIR
jgi:peptide/nickel transport system permease protein